MSVMATKPNLANKQVTHWVAEVLPLFHANIFLFWLVVLQGNIKKARVLLPQLNEWFLHFNIPPDSSIPLPLHHVYIYMSEHSVILLANNKEHVVGDQTRQEDTKKFWQARLFIGVRSIPDATSLFFSYVTLHVCLSFPTSTIRPLNTSY